MYYWPNKLLVSKEFIMYQKDDFKNQTPVKDKTGLSSTWTEKNKQLTSQQKTASLNLPKN